MHSIHRLPPIDMISAIIWIPDLPPASVG